MATLVLTTVGGMIGGPVGAALGAMIGQTVDRGLIFPARGREGPRLTELAVQTSRYGAPIPKVFGTMRVAGQVIWAADLHEHRDRQGGGKGQPSVTSYSYSASFAVALSARPILRVGRIWADGNLLRGAAGDWKVAAGFRLHRGDEEQAADPLIASAEGIGLAPAHRGIAYAVFEGLPLERFGNRIPSLTFEVVADAGPVTTGAVAREIGAGVLGGTAAALSLDGFSAHGESCRGVLEMLAALSAVRFVAVPGGLALRDDAAPERTVAGERQVRRIAPLERVPKLVSVAHYDPARDWQIGVQQAARPGAGTAARAIEAPVAVSAATAKAMALGALARAEAERATRRIVLDGSAADIAPGSIVSISGEAGAWRVTGAAFERHAVTLDLVALAPPVLPVAASGGRAAPAPDLIVGATLLHAFEAPAEDGLAVQPQVAVVAAGTGAGWRRAALQLSLDGGGTWQPAGGTAAPGVVGTLATPLAGGSATLADRRAAIDVVLAHAAMALGDADAAALDRGANLARIGEELLQFARAVPLGGGRWRLEGLWRGRRGTVAAPVAAGAPVTLLDRDAVRLLPVAALPGERVQVIASGAGDAAGVPVEVALAGAALLPPAPVRLAMSRRGDGALLAWRRRSRGDWRWRDGVDAALGEEREAYRVTIASAAGERNVEVAAPELMLAAAELAAGPLTLTVRQLGTHGLSPPATITI